MPLRHAMKPVIIEFNGLGRPTTLPIESGHVAILVQNGKREVVRIELLSPDDYGPRFHHATNQPALAADVEQFWSSLDTRELVIDRDWVIDCPKHISQKAKFELAN